MNASKEKPKNGRLLRKYPSGKIETLAYDKPFSELQITKKKYRMMGVPVEQLIITYNDPKK